MLARACAAFSFGLALLASASALAADTVAIRGDEPGCPSPAQVLEAVQAILPSAAAGTDAAAMSVQLVDEGRGLQVIAGETGRRFADPGRHCLERARKAALFIALRLGSTRETTETTPASAPPPSEPVEAAPPSRPAEPTTAMVEHEEAPPAPRPPRPLSLRETIAAIHGPTVELEIAGLFTSAPIGDVSVGGGGAARIYAGIRHVGAVLGVSAQSPVELHGLPAARLLRVPVELGVRGRAFWHELVLAFDFAFTVGAQQTRGIDLPGSLTATRTEAGFTSRAHVAYFVTRRIAPFVELGVTGLLTRYLLTVPDRVYPVAETPRLWVNVLAGLSVRVR